VIQAEEEKRESLPCGYGLLGLCCSDCLAGPCRFSPFDDPQAKGMCGADADLLVARNLLRLTFREGIRSLKFLREALRESRERRKNQGLIAVAEGADGKQIACRYKLARGGGESILSFLEKESLALLAPVADEPPSLFRILFPETVFPHLLPESHLGSLTEEILELTQLDQKENRDFEEWWRRVLRATIPILAAEELTRDLLTLLHSASSMKDGWEETRKFLESWPDSAQPFMILFSTQGGFRSPVMGGLAQGLKQNIPRLRSLSIREVADLSRIGRFLCEKWSRPVSALAAVVLLESPGVLPTLASLALGFSAASHPSMPIQGSGQAKRFFTEGLRRTGQNFYLAGGDETAFSRISRSLQERIS
jgi:hypothetical protein